jgi:hypothetical protein
MLLLQASWFLIPSKHRNAQSGCQERETDHRNSLNVGKEINHFHARNMWSDIIYANREAKCNPLESVPEVITW